MTWPRQPNISIEVAKAIPADTPITVTWEPNGPVTLAAGGVTLRRIPPDPAPWWARFWPWYKIVVLFDLPRCAHCKGAGQCSEGAGGSSCKGCVQTAFALQGHLWSDYWGLPCSFCKGTGKEALA